MRVLLALLLASPIHAQDPPNILWITSEDNGPHLGCYGDPDADTPHIDALAARSTCYERCWSNAPVCAPARTTIITGMYATSLGAEHMRSFVSLPDDVRLFPAYLRDAGYYCTNRSKEDYNVGKPGRVWDDSSRKAHWRGREPGQPFFAVMNKQSYRGLSKAHRDIIDRTSGEKLSMKASRIYMADGVKGRNALKSGKNRTYTVLSDAEIAKAVTRLKAAEAKIVSDIEAEGIPVGKVLSALRGAGS